jgi:hypothetical protein
MATPYSQKLSDGISYLHLQGRITSHATTKKLASKSLAFHYSEFIAWLKFSALKIEAVRYSETSIALRN